MASKISSDTPLAHEVSLEAKTEFFALNTTVSAVVSDWAEGWRLPRIQAYFDSFEGRFSRFRPDSELCFLNHHTGQAVEVSAEMVELLSECRRFVEVTGGIFNPSVLPQLEATGYDRSFELLPENVKLTGTRSQVGLFSIEVDPATNVVKLPAGDRLDLGGIGKGYAIDHAAACLGIKDCLIEAGGDIFAAGTAPDGRPWLIDVGHPSQTRAPLARLALTNQAVATSSTAKRRWRTNAGWANHIIDPRSGLSVENNVLAVTVVAHEAVSADVYAKTALILGPLDGLDFLHSVRAEGLMVLRDGSVRTTLGWPGLLA